MKRKTKKVICCCMLLCVIISLLSSTAYAGCVCAYSAPSQFQTLQLGSSGITVKVLQRFLSNYGQGWSAIIASHGGIDGSFGSTTNSLVLDFQDDMGLYPDGVVGTNTWTKISMLTYEETTTYPSSSLSHSGTMKTNYYCYSPGNNIWKYSHLSEGQCHCYYCGGNTLVADWFKTISYGADDFDYGYG